MRQIILFVIVLIVVIQCDSDNGEKIKFVEPDFEKELLFKGDSLLDQFYISRFDFDQNKNLYLFDTNSYAINKFDSTGRKVDKTGKEGPGPEEFDKNVTHFLKWATSDLVIYTIEKQELRFYDSDLNFIESKIFKDPFQEFDYNSKGETIYSFLDHRNTHALRFFETSSFDRKNISFDLDLDKSNLYYNIFSLKFIGDNRFVAGYIYRNKVVVFSSNGERINEFNIPGWAEKSEVSGSYYVPDKIMIQDITVAENGEIWILGGGYAKNRRRDIFVFNKDGKYKYTFTLPSETPQINFMDGNLYTLNSDRNNIIKWNISF